MTPEESVTRAVRRRRIFLKLEALCEAHSDCEMLGTIASVVAATRATVGTDTDMEAALDKALAEDGVTVSGGWKS